MDLVMEESCKICLITGTPGRLNFHWGQNITNICCFDVVEFYLEEFYFLQRLQESHAVPCSESKGQAFREGLALMVCESDYEDHVSKREAIQMPNIPVFTSRRFSLYCARVWTYPQSKYTIVCVLLC